MSFKKIAGSNIFLIMGLITLAIGGSQFYRTTIAPRIGLGGKA
jgi:hypothetical protein